MTKNEILKFLNENPIVYLATVDAKNHPHVRGMMLFSADTDGLIFHTGTGKEINDQLEQNPAVEMCAFNHQNVQVRVSGVAEFVDDLALKQTIVAARPFLQQTVDTMGYEQFIVFRVTQCVATVWTMEDNLAPKTFVPLTD